ncbi:MAG: 2-phospho-L-lactate transferase [Dehalococcoidia bacterium]
MKMTVLCGGVGAAKFLYGLQHAVENTKDINAIINVSDDFIWHGFHISPDIDTLIYTLTEKEGPLGWGIQDDTFSILNEINSVTNNEWFQIGDRDLVTHILRNEALHSGKTLSQTTQLLAENNDIQIKLFPVTDDSHPTLIITENNELEFQEYFVRRKTEEHVKDILFPNANFSTPAPGVLNAIKNADFIIFAPSNPFVSIDPILAVPQIREHIIASSAQKIAISPIVGGQAIKGPAAKMMKSMGHSVSPLGVAKMYQKLIDTFIFDIQDSDLAKEINELNIKAITMDTIMDNRSKRISFAKEFLTKINE